MRYGTKRAKFSLLAGVLFLALSASQRLHAGTISFNFGEICSGCTGDGDDVLVLSDEYTLGTALTDGDFVSFSYVSNLVLSFTITVSDSESLQGTLPNNLPVAEDVITITDSGENFTSDSTAHWCLSSTSGCGDIRSPGIWSDEDPAPKPGLFTLILMGARGLALL